MKPQLTRRQFLQGAGTVMTAITLTSLARSICFQRCPSI
ncbi:MAG: twin-arginine translocation signal domain-containing protein [Caldilineaceae bacterium]